MKSGSAETEGRTFPANAWGRETKHNWPKTATLWASRGERSRPKEVRGEKATLKGGRAGP